MTITLPKTLETAGEEFQLTCTVAVPEHLAVQPTVQWSGGSVGSDGVTVSATNHSGATSTRTLRFSPLMTSHGAQYTCHTTINMPIISVMRMGSNSTDVNVQSM